MTNSNQFQQGDVLITKIDTMPPGGVTVSRKRCVLAEGEVTGHAHVVEEDEAELIQIGERMILSLKNSATLVHEEHGAFTLNPGIYEIGKVNEYDYFSMMVRKVAD